MEKLSPLLFSIKKKHGVKKYQKATEWTHSPWRSAHEKVRMGKKERKISHAHWEFKGENPEVCESAISSSRWWLVPWKILRNLGKNMIQCITCMKWNHEYWFGGGGGGQNGRLCFNCMISLMTLSFGSIYSKNTLLNWHLKCCYPLNYALITVFNNNNSWNWIQNCVFNCA